MASKTQKGATESAPNGRMTNDEFVQNAAECINKLEEVFIGLKNGTMTLKEAREINKSARRAIAEARRQLKAAQFKHS